MKRKSPKTPAAAQPFRPPFGRRLLFTGEGKGKTTAALGMVLRAVGHGQTVHLAQFFKTGISGEVATLRLLPEVRVSHDGLGLVRGDPEPHRQAARRLWQAVRDAEAAAPARLLVLDEICLAAHWGFVGEAEVAELLYARPKDSVTVLTGRHAPPGLVAMADTATDMRCLRHGATMGWPAQKGVEL